MSNPESNKEQKENIGKEMLNISPSSVKGNRCIKKDKALILCYI